jgi:4-amino-4-deoxy-L-arabinose transferase-like glycosyltransferase
MKIKHLSFCLPLCVIGSLVAVFIPNLANFIFLNLICLGILIITCQYLVFTPGNRSFIIAISVLSYVIHLAVGEIIANNSQLTIFFGGDALQYNAYARLIILHWTQGLPMPGLPAGKQGFYYMAAGLFYLFGQSNVVNLPVDSLFMALCTPILWDVTFRVFDENTAKIATIILLVLPGFLVWGSQFLREPGVYLFECLALSSSFRLSRRFSLSSFFILIVSLGLLLVWRADIALMLVAAITLSSLFTHKKAFLGAARSASIVTTFLLLAVVGGFGYSGLHYVTHSSLTQINQIRQYSSTIASSGFLQNSDISTASKALSFLPIGSVMVLFGPFPWQIDSLRQIWAIPDALCWWILIPSLIRGIRNAIKVERYFSILSVLSGVFILFPIALIIGNFGTAVRERMQIIIILIPLIAFGFRFKHIKTKVDAALVRT